MLKFLRKYNKWILVVAASFLMVAFLAPQAIQQWGQNQEKRVVGRIGEERVRQVDLRTAGAEARLAEMVLPAGLLAERDAAAHWLLLRTEAGRGGYVGAAGDGAKMLEEMAQQIGYEIGFQQFMQNWVEEQQIPQQFLSQIMSQLRGQLEGQWQSQYLSDQALQSALAEQGRNVIYQRLPGQTTQQELYESLAQVRGVQRMFREWSQVGVLSERRALARIEELGRQAWGRAVFLPGRELAPGVPEPTQEEIQAHFERFNTVSPEEGEYGFGYTLPPRVKLETLVLDRQAIEAAVTPDAIEVRKLWASQRQPQGPYPEEFAEARDAVEAEVRSRIVEEVIEIAQQAVRAAVWPQIRQLDTRGAYRVVTENFVASRPAMEDVAQLVKERVADSAFPLASGGSVEIPAPVINVYDQWLTPQDVSELEVVGQSALRYAGGRVPLSQALFEVREIAGDSNLGLQQHITPVQMPAVTPDGSLVYYTVLDTRPQSPPDSMDEIRDDVVADLKALTAYQRLTSELDSYREVAITDGLEAAAARFGDALAAAGSEAETPPVTREARFTTQGVTQDGMAINELSHEVVLDSVLERARQLDPSAAPEEITAEEAMVATPVDREMGVALVRILAPRPITREQVRANAMALSRFVMEREMAEIGLDENPFGFDALRRRLNYVDLEQGEDDAAPRTAPAGETVDPGAEAPADETEPG